MLKKTRTILFLICLLLFFLTAPLALLYSQGYRFDFENKKLTQTGGLGIKAEPKQVEIYINNELIKKTDFLFGSAFIENLLPKKYKIEVKKKGYLAWEKNLEIKEKEVTEIKNIILFPENINLTILTPNQKNSVSVKNFWFSPDKKKMILLEEEKSSSTPQFSEENPGIEETKKTWTLKLYDLERNIKSHLISESDIYQGGVNLLNLEFSEDSKEIYLDIEAAEGLSGSAAATSAIENKKKTFTLKLDKLPPELAEKKIIPLPENIIISKKHNQDTYHLDVSGYLLKNESKINETPFPIRPEAEYSFEIFSDFIFLTDQGRNFYLFSYESRSFEVFFERMNGLKISPDNNKLVFFSNSEIWILFLRNEGIRKAGEKLFISRLSEKIDKVFWLNSDYLIFNSGNNLKIAEIDERDRIQTWDIVILTNFGAEAKIYFNKNDKKLYVLNEGDLFVSEKIF